MQNRFSISTLYDYLYLLAILFCCLRYSNTSSIIENNGTRVVRLRGIEGKKREAFQVTEEML
jgi:hypothetical protein